MKIYTKTGDRGSTALWGGTRVRKDDALVEAYGSVDELTTTIGVLLTHKLNDSDTELLTQVQRDLYSEMSLLCGAEVDLNEAVKTIETMEKRIDVIEKEKPTPPRFVLVQGSPASVWAHMARVVCRKAERRVVTALVDKSDERSQPKPKKNELENQTILIQYLNRLSDLFFALARYYNSEKELLT